MQAENVPVPERLIVALDVPSLEAGIDLIRKLPSVKMFKIGLEAYAAGFGDALRMEVYRHGAKAMVDLKIHDIPETVSRAVAALNGKARFATVHATVQVMRAARAGMDAAQAPGNLFGGIPVGVLAVTVLTSMNDADLIEDGYTLPLTARALVAKRAARAAEVGVRGVVASPQEVAFIRQAVGAKLTIVTPGVRPAGTATGDQKRVGTPGQAIRDGADYLVVGRPIRDAADPDEAAVAIQHEIAQALADRTGS